MWWMLWYSASQLCTEMGQGQHVSTATATTRRHSSTKIAMALPEMSQGLQQQGGTERVSVLLWPEGEPRVRPLAGATLMWPDLLTWTSTRLRPPLLAVVSSRPMPSLSQDGAKRLLLWQGRPHCQALQLPSLVVWETMWEDAFVRSAHVSAYVSRR